MKNNEITLKVKLPLKEDVKHSKGILLSFFTAFEEFTEGRRKLSYLHHFYRERLNKKERRLFLFLLRGLSEECKQGQEAPLEKLTENFKEKNDIPEYFITSFSNFGKLK